MCFLMCFNIPECSYLIFSKLSLNSSIHSNSPGSCSVSSYVPAAKASQTHNSPVRYGQKRAASASYGLAFQCDGKDSIFCSWGL